MSEHVASHQTIMDELGTLTRTFNYEKIVVKIAELLRNSNQFTDTFQAQLLLNKGRAELALLRDMHADESLERALQIFAAQDLRQEETQCRIELAKVAARNSNRTRAAVHLEICERHMEGRDWPVEQAVVASERAALGILISPSQQGIETLRTAIAQLHDLGEDTLALRYETKLAFAYSLNGQSTECNQLIRSLIPQFKESGDLRSLSQLANTQAVIDLYNSDMDAARRGFELAAKYERELNRKSNLVAIHNNLAILELSIHDLTACRRNCNRALHYSTIAQADMSIAGIYMLQALCALFENNWKEAANLAQLAWTETRNLTDIDAQIVNYYTAICFLGVNDCSSASHYWEAKPELIGSWEMERERAWFMRALNHLLDIRLTATVPELQAARELATAWLKELKDITPPAG